MTTKREVKSFWIHSSWNPTLMACPKKPFPKISPWMRSHGLKMRWEQLLEDLKDSERPMSLVMNGCSLGEFGTGDLQMLLLRLKKRTRLISITSSLISSSYSAYCWQLSNLKHKPQRPPFQCAIINHISSLQDGIRWWGQAHAGCCWDSQPVPGRSQPETVQTLPDWVIFYEQLQSLTCAMN